MPRTWRCAVVGMGLVGEWHARGIARLDEAKLAAVCSRNTDKAREALRKHHLGEIPVYADLTELLQREAVDVVHVCTPSGNHLEPAIVAMKAGKNVVCEKPLEISLERVDQMIETSRRHGVRLAGIFQRRWEPANQALRQAVQEVLRSPGLGRGLYPLVSDGCVLCRRGLAGNLEAGRGRGGDEPEHPRD